MFWLGAPYAGMSRSLAFILFFATILHADITQLVPDQVTAGSGPVTLRAFGGYFLEGETLLFNGTRLNTVVVGGGGMYSYATELRATIPAELLRNPGSATVTLAGYNSLPFTINPPPRILTPSPLPAGAQGAAYSRSIEVSGGTPRFEWNLVASGNLPPGLTLNRGTGLISGTPTAQGVFTFTVEARDASQVAVKRLYTLTIGAPTSLSNSLTCIISPRNSLLPMHIPEAHLNSRKLYPDHTLRVTVTALSGSVANLPITLTASQALFPDNTGLPTALTRTVNTDASGVATVVINPLSNTSFDTTTLDVTVRRGTQESTTCQGTIVSGAGAMFGVMQNVRRDANVVLGALQHRLDFDGDRFYPELERILAQDPELERRALAAYDKHFPTLRRILAGQTQGVSKRELRELDELVARLEAHASADLKKVFLDWRRELRVAGSSLQPLRHAKLQGLDRLPLEAGPDPKAQALLAARPVSFERNDGQAPRGVHFLARGLRESALFSEQGLDLRFPDGASLPLRLGGVQRWPQPQGLEPLATQSHYLSRRARLQAPHFSRVRYANIYPQTDLVFYSDAGHLRHDFVLAPGADPSRIQLQFPGQQEISAQPDGSLAVHLNTGTTTLGRPFVYQERQGQRIAIASRYTAHPRGGIGFELGAYDKQLPLVIDPIVSYSAFHGGEQIDAALAISVDAQGSAYIAGLTSSNNWPSTARALNGTARPSATNVEAFVTKFSPDGRTVLFTTYLGGSGLDSASALALDAAGNIYVGGQTDSRDFPTRNALQASYGGGNQETGGDGYVMKLNPAGNAVIYSTYLGGSRGETVRSLAVDSTGAVYLTGMTASNNFPTRNAFQSSSRGGPAAQADAYLAKLHPDGNALIYSTYLGGSGDDFGMALQLDAQNNVVLTGATYSTDFPTVLALQPANAGGADVFFTKVNATGNALTYSTYLGGSSDDFGIAVALDSIGNVHLGGLTGSADFPVARGAQMAFGSPNGMGFDGFVSKFFAASNDLVYSTFIGGSGTDLVNGLTVGPDNSVYLAGETNSANFPTRNAMRPQGAQSDAFLAKLNPDGSVFEYSGALGGQALDSATAIALDRADNVYLAGSTTSRDNPATLGAAQSILGGRGDAFAMKITPGQSLPFVNLFGAADLLPGGAAAPESIVSAFGNALAPRLEAAASSQLPLSLAGTTVQLRDSAGATHTAPLYFVAPTQVNFLVPRGVALGLAELNILSNGQTVGTATLRIGAVAPGLFSANANGRGAPAGFAVRSDGSTPLFRCGGSAASAAGPCQPNRIDISSPTFLTLYGTGLRGAAAAGNVVVSIGGRLPVTYVIPVTFIGAQGDFPGLDQLNVGPLPAALIGAGPLELMLNIGGELANRLSIEIQ